MNIQIFGKSKCFDTKKALRYFSDRGIRVQYVDLGQKGLSRGEWNSVKRAVGSLDAMLDEGGKDKQLLTLLRYLTEDAKEDKMFENQSLLRTPIVRNEGKATIGYQPEVWGTW